MEVILAKKAGFCFGVKRAVKLAEEAAKTEKKVQTLGPIVHNPQAVKKLEGLGIKSVKDLNGVHEGAVIIRAHGVPPEVYEEAKRKGLKVLDATCPFVKRAQDYGRMLEEDGYAVVVIGEKEHPEVIGIKGHAKNKAVIIESVEEAEAIPFSAKIGVVVQTTQEQALVAQITPVLFEKCKELRVFNTICSATSERQEAVKELAGQVDVIIVVGGKNSGNTRRLAQIASRIAPTHHIETAAELKAEWFKDVKRAGVAAGASTPDFVIEEVVKKLETR